MTENYGEMEVDKEEIEYVKMVVEDISSKTSLIERHEFKKDLETCVRWMNVRERKKTRA